MTSEVAASGRLAEVTARHFHLLRLVPRSPAKIDAGRLHARLRSLGIEMHRRSLLRDLTHLEARIPGLSCDRRSRPFGWSWTDAEGVWWVGMDPHLAVALRLLELLGPLLPRKVRRSLAHAFTEARATLARATDPELARWLDLVEPLLPKANAPLAEDLLTALFEARSVAVSLPGRGGAPSAPANVAPIGLSGQGEKLALVARVLGGQGSNPDLAGRASPEHPLRLPLVRGST